MSKKIRIVSDGDPFGTRVFDCENGIELSGVTRVEILPITRKSGPVTAKISFEDVELDMTAEIDALRAERDRLKTERDEAEAALDLIDAAYKRAAEYWQKQTGQPLTYPDYGALAMWLMDQIETQTPDKERLDWLEARAQGYGHGWIARDSTTGRGYRLHESSQPAAVPTARAAIDKARQALEGQG